jgi:hypothetical protein
MSKAVGWTVGAAIVSITIGILVGLVLHTGQLERADRGPSAVGGLGGSSTTSTSTPPPSPATSSALSSTTQTPPLPPPRTSPLSTPSSLPPTPPAALSSAPPAVTTPPTAPRGTSLSGVPVTSTAPTAATGTAANPRPGSDAAGSPCAALAARSSDAAGTTLYCQVDRADRTLRWRAVVNGGGCLNQSMTGTAADGLAYRCRLDASGLNHWAPAG